MSRGRRRIRREQPAGRPSIFFMVALTLGILIVLWFFVQTLRHPAKHGSAGRPTTTEMSPSKLYSALQAAVGVICAHPPRLTTSVSPPPCLSLLYWLVGTVPGNIPGRTFSTS